MSNSESAQARKPRRPADAVPAPAPVYVIVGRILRPHGVRGLLRLAPDTDFPQRLRQLRQAVLLKHGTPTPVTIESARSIGEEMLLKIAGVESRDAAAAWRGADLAVPRSDAAPLPPDYHYVFEIIGLRVEAETGEVLGTITEILRTGSNDVYVVMGETREILIPAISSVVVTIDPAAGRLVIRPLPGMLD